MREILSTNNEAYMELIAEQQRGDLRPVCQSCDYYKSIYRMQSSYRRERTPLQTLEEFKGRLNAAAGSASSLDREAPVAQ